MKFRTLLFSLALLFSSAVFSQVSYHHGVGFGLTLHALETMIDDVKETSDKVIGGLTYSARLNFVELSDDLSFSANFKPTFGFYAYSDTHGNSDSGINIETPVFVALNYLGGATRSSDYNLGGYVGAGYSYFVYDDNDDITRGSYVEGHGPIFMLGFRTAIKYLSFGIRASYMLDISDRFDKSNLFSLGGLYYFGRY